MKFDGNLKKIVFTLDRYVIQIFLIEYRLQRNLFVWQCFYSCGNVILNKLYYGTYECVIEVNQRTICRGISKLKVTLDIKESFLETIESIYDDIYDYLHESTLRYWKWFFMICRTKLLRKESSLIKMYGNYFDVSHSTKFSHCTPLKLTLISVSLCLSLCNTEECYWYTIPFLTWFNCKIYNPCSMHYEV